jgi:hypothetical protein
LISLVEREGLELSTPGIMRNEVVAPRFYAQGRLRFGKPNPRRSTDSDRRCPQIADQPAGTYAKQILNRLLIDLAWNSSRLEGNTYSLLDTERLIELGEEAEGRAPLEAQMILNHKDAIEFLVGDADVIRPQLGRFATVPPCPTR